MNTSCISLTNARAHTTTTLKYTRNLVLPLANGMRREKKQQPSIHSCMNTNTNDVISHTIYAYERVSVLYSIWLTSIRTLWLRRSMQCPCLCFAFSVLTWFFVIVWVVSDLSAHSTHREWWIWWIFRSLEIFDTKTLTFSETFVEL